MPYSEQTPTVVDYLYIAGGCTIVGFFLWHAVDWGRIGALVARYLG
jgi:hypothetical protein